MTEERRPPVPPVGPPGEAARSHGLPDLPAVWAGAQHGGMGSAAGDPRHARARERPFPKLTRPSAVCDPESRAVGILRGGYGPLS